VFRRLLIILFLITLLIPLYGRIPFSAGLQYSSYTLYMDDEDAEITGGFGGEIGITDILPHIGLKLRMSKIRFTTSAENIPYDYEYMPVSLCTSFDMLPFYDAFWLSLTMETGFGYYFWKGMQNDEIVILPTGGKMDERDYGFLGGFTIQLKPLRNIAIEFSTRYNYIASSNIHKYGYFDKDEKLWENGIGIKYLIQ